MSAQRFVSASELAQFAYCRRAWWLRAVQGVSGDGESTRFDRGRRAHLRFMRRMVLGRALLWLSILLAILALAFCVGGR